MKVDIPKCQSAISPNGFTLNGHFSECLLFLFLFYLFIVFNYKRSFLWRIFILRGHFSNTQVCVNFGKKKKTFQRNDRQNKNCLVKWCFGRKNFQTNDWTYNLHKLACRETTLWNYKLFGEMTFFFGIKTVQKSNTSGYEPDYIYILQDV